MKSVHMVAFLLMFVGALNWGLVGLLNINVVNMLLGQWMGLEKLVYILVGVSAVYIMATHMNDCRVCSVKGKK
jgi:uncharacterized protein